MNFLKKTEQYFEFRERNTGWNFELIGGVTTFLTMSYFSATCDAVRSAFRTADRDGPDGSFYFGLPCLGARVVFYGADCEISGGAGSGNGRECAFCADSASHLREAVETSFE